LYMHPEPDSIIERIPKYDIVEIPGLQSDFFIIYYIL
jgi:hypothetical protein